MPQIRELRLEDEVMEVDVDPRLELAKAYRSAFDPRLFHRQAHCGDVVLFSKIWSILPYVRTYDVHKVIMYLPR